MRVLFSNDWHIGVPPVHKYHRQDIQDAVEYTVNYAVHNQVNIFVCGGDSLNKPSRLLNEEMIFLAGIVRHLEKNNIKFYYTTGNHDYHTTPLMRSFDSVNTIDRSNYIDNCVVSIDDNTELVLLPYLWKHDKLPLLPQLNKNRIIVTHQIIEGMQLSLLSDSIMERIFSKEDILSLYPTTIIGGHLHLAQQFEIDNIKIYIPGSISILRFSEIESLHGFYLFDTEDKSYTYNSQLRQRKWHNLTEIPDNIYPKEIYHLTLPYHYSNELQTIRDHFNIQNAEVIIRIDKPVKERTIRIEHIENMSEEDRVIIWLKDRGITDVTPYITEHRGLLHYDTANTR